MRRTTTRAAGYTLIEVMTAVVVLTIGATGILAMQGASVRSNRDASETSTAINWAVTWVERIKRDAYLWNQSGNGDLANTWYLSNATANNGVWIMPATTTPAGQAILESAGADLFGYDVAAANADNIRFCVNLRFTVAQAYNPATGTMLIASDANAVRADVRVWWHRNSLDVNRVSPTCLGGVLTAAQIVAPQIRKHYLSTVVTWRTPGWP
jgi:prepilin-type N-terminal cleavage/methylation domain-containing protein